MGLALLAATGGWAATFPKPEPERQFAELKVYDAAGRPWRAAVEDWAGARQRVAADPAWAQWLQKERDAVDRWSAKHRDRVSWIAGWSHDGVSPKDGSRVTWDERIPREEVSHFSSPSDPKIEITPKLHAWWVVSFRDRHVETLVRAARLFRLTGETRYATWVSGQIDFYADNFLQWEPQRPGHQARLFWQTLTEATNLVKFAEAVRLLGDAVPAAQRERWREQFFTPEVQALNANFQSIHNIATWQRCAVAQVALLFGDEPMWRAALDGPFGLRRQMAEGITSDYLWHEQSLGYNAYVVRAVMSLFTAAGLQGRAAELAPEMATAENLMLAPLYLRFPNGFLPNPADSGGLSQAPNRELFAETYRVFPTTLGLEEAAGRRDWNTLLDPPPASPHRFTLPPVASRNLASSRMAVLREGGWQVFVHYGQLTKSHSQSEALNYSAAFGETDITHDPGTVGYGSPLYRGYYTRGLNHNVPLVNGEGQTPPQAGVLESFSAQPPRVAVAQPAYRAEARAARTLAIEGGALVDRSSVESKKGAQRLGQALHLQGRVRLSAEFAPASDFAPGRPDSFGHWRDVRAASFTDRAELVVDYGKGVVMRVTVTAPGAFRLWHGSSPDVPPRRRESLYLELAEPAERAAFTTTFAPVNE
ncbi:alginate lyase family protein [Horticoccus sp. 23ND18S-11]|uniref:alginate lyase family protein n=1 Tax=Horticoccus sp. 23ND18S-11 TaxID=3391832 RepID=UPI0039C92A09